MRVLTGFVAAIVTSGAAMAGAVVSNNGNLVYIDDAGTSTELTTTGLDQGPVLSPDGTFIFFIRSSGDNAAMENCASDASEPKPVSLMRINVDGSGEAEVMRTKPDEAMEKTVCAFDRGQFNSTGSKFYFDTPAWTTSAALHVVDVNTGTEKFVTAGGDVWVITKCVMREHIDQIAVPQHRYYAFGGTYDWWYLYDETGKEIGVIGESMDPASEACKG